MIYGGVHMYIIGLIDDEESELKKIRRVIKTLCKDETYNFKSYLVPNKTENLVETMFAEILEDIIHERISSLIVDYKIMVEATKVQGTEILKMIKDKVPKFPVIILTEIVEESMQPIYVDADKVYRKKDFFKIEEDYAKEKVYNIFDSMKKYVNQRDSLETSIKDFKERFLNGENMSNVIPNILTLESKLNDFVTVDQTQIDKVFDVNKAKEIVKLIERANEILE